jgi:hypothetical protein
VSSSLILQIRTRRARSLIALPSPSIGLPSKKQLRIEIARMPTEYARILEDPSKIADRYLVCSSKVSHMLGNGSGHQRPNAPVLRGCIRVAYESRSELDRVLMLLPIPQPRVQMSIPRVAVLGNSRGEHHSPH